MTDAVLADRKKWENLLAVHLDGAGIAYTRQARIIQGRKFAFDFLVYRAIDTLGADLLVEVEGGTWSGGRHVRGKGFESGCEKQACALLAGYRELRVTGDQVKSGQALRWIEMLIGRKERS